MNHNGKEYKDEWQPNHYTVNQLYLKLENFLNCTPKTDNIDEMDKFLQPHKLT